MNAIQKRLVSMGAMLAAAGAVAAFAYFGTFKTKQKEEEEKQKDEKVASFTKSEEVSELTIENKGTTFKLVGDGQGEQQWRLTAPMAVAAEKQAVDSVISHFAEMKRKRSFESSPADAKTFGLDPAVATVVMKLKDGKEETFKVGKKNSFDDNVYLQRVGDNKVSMVPNAITGYVEKDLFALREKRLAIFEDKDVASIQVEFNGKSAYNLTKRGEDWFITSPVEAKAEKAQANTLMSSIRFLRAAKFASETPDAKALAGFGLDKPALTVTLGLAADAKLKLVFGTSKDGNTKYAMVASGGPVLEISDDLPKKFAIALNDLRDKQVAAFEREKVAKIVMKDGETTLTLEKKKNDKQEDAWVFGDGKPTMDGRVSSLIWRLSSLRSKSIVTDKVDANAKKSAGLEPPARSLELFDSEGKALAFFAFGSEQGEGVQMFADAGRRIDLVDKTAVAEIKFEATYYQPEAPVAAGGEATTEAK